MSEDLISLGEKLRRTAARKPDAPAVTCGPRTLTWREFDLRTNRLARALEARGVKFGDLVTIGLPNSVEFIEASWACWKLGATPQPVSHRLPEAELRAIVELADPPLVIAGPGLEGGRPRVEPGPLIDATPDDSPLEDRVAPILKAPTSGGSTGRPKLILSGAPGALPERPADGGLWRFTWGETALIPAPLYHNGPFITALAALAYESHLVLTPRFDAEETLALIARERAAWVYLVPTMMTRIWRLPEEVRARYDLSSLKTLWHLAAPCPPWLKDAFIDWLGPDVVMELYGGTEGQAGTVISGREWREHRGSVGRPYMGEIIAIGEGGERLGPGEVGEIYMRWAPGGAPTYAYRGAEARTLDGGWESLGDIGWFDEDGYLYLADRRTDMILVGGSNVYPAEVEAAIDEHPSVQSSAVIGLPDEDLGSRVHAIVQARDGLTEAELLAHLSDKLVTYKRPRSFEFVSEPLRDEAGKVRRSALRAERMPAPGPRA